jgi:hypothetical protein
MLAAAGCNSTDDVTNPGSGGVSAERLAAVMVKVREAPLARAAAGAVQRVWGQAIDCPATYDLGDATGTCFHSVGTSYYYGTVIDFNYMLLTNHVSVAGGGSALDVTFDLRVEPIGGDEYVIEVFNSTAAVSEGSGAWSLRGNASPDGHFDANLQTSRGPWTLRNGDLEFADARSPYMTFRVGLDSGVGEIQLGGSPFASLAVDDGCVTVNFVDPGREDEQTCQW